MEVVNSVQIKKSGLKPFSFANVKKETLGQTFENWNRLLKSQSIESIEDFKEILTPSVPLSAFEDKLRVILIDTFQLKNEVLNILLSQNDYTIKRVLRCKWFFQNLSAEFCILKIFPSVSLSVRCKIINKLSKYLENEEEAEKLFKFVASNFGYEGAESLLPKCSSEFILDYCQKQRPLVTFPIWKRQRILLKICRRYPDIGLEILKLKFDHKTKSRCYYNSQGRVILQYLAGNHVDLFIHFFKEYIQKLQTYPRTFSGKMSWKLALKLEDFFFKSRLIDSDILNIKYVFLKLNPEEKIKCLSALVHFKSDKLTLRNWYLAKGKLTDLIRCTQPSQRYSIITSVFKEVYDLDFQDHSKCWYFDLLEVLPSKDRQYFAESMERFYLSSEAEFKEFLDPDHCYKQQEIERAIYLYEFPVAFVKFKRIIRKSPEKSRRENIMLYMVKCCKINNDAKGLTEVVDFVATNHRHEDAKILSSFTSNICNLFPELTSSICRKLKNLLLFCLAKGSFDIYSFIRFAERDIYLCLEENKETRDLIKEFFEIAVRRLPTYGSYMSNFKNKHSRTLLLALGEKTREWIETHPTDTTWERLHSSWINTCENFNKVNKKNKVILRDVPGYAEVLKELFKTKYEKLSVQDWPLEALETCEIQALNTNSLSKLYYHFLKTNPEVVIKDLEPVFDFLDNRVCTLLIKQLRFLGATDILKETALNNFRKNSFRVRYNALNIYTYVCTIEEFTDVVQEYIPQMDQVEEGADQIFVEIQLKVPRVINRIRPRWKNLNLVLKFFRGDFLKETVWSFYSTCCHSRVDFIVPFLKELISKMPARVSHTKDLIRLIFLLSSRDESISFGLKCWQDNKHYSIWKIIFKFLRKMFLEEPTRELFNSLMNCLLESEEVMFVDEKPDITKIPKEFVGEYAMALWKVSKNFTVKNYFRRTLISNFNLDNISLLSEEFCEEVMREYFSDPESLLGAGEFAAFYCAAGQGPLTSRIQMIFKLMQEYQTNAQRTISFLKIIRNKSHANPAQFLDVFFILLENWPNSSSMYEEKLQYLYYASYYRILEKFSEPSVVSAEFGNELQRLYSYIPNRKDLVIVVVDTLNQFIREIRRTKLPFHPLLVLRNLIKNSWDRTILIIAVGALSPDLVELYEEGDAVTNKDDDKTVLKEIYQILENQDDIFLIYFRRIFKENKPVISTPNLIIKSSGNSVELGLYLQQFEA